MTTDKSILGINSRIIYESRNKSTLNRNQYVLGVINKKRNRKIDLYDIDAIFNINQKIRKIEQKKYVSSLQKENIGEGKISDCKLWSHIIFLKKWNKIL